MKYLLCFITAFLLSCSEEKVTTAKGTLPQENEITKDNFGDYWRYLGDGLATNDLSILNTCIADTLQVYGREDQDPHLLLVGQERIDQVMSLYKTGSFYEGADSNFNCEELFRHKPEELRGYDKNSDEHWIEEDFVMRKKGNEWKLALIFANTKENE